MKVVFDVVYFNGEFRIAGGAFSMLETTIFKKGNGGINEGVLIMSG